MLSAVLAWWVLQLRGLVPGWLWPSEQDRVRRQALVLDVIGWSPCAVEVAVRRGRREGALGRFALDSAGIVALRAAAARHLDRVAVLRLPAGVLLEKRASFPLVAERHLASVLAYEMDRITPFSAAELFWTWRVARRDGMRVHALVSLVPRAPLTPVLDALRQAGIRPALLQSPVDPETGGVCQVPLEPTRGVSWRWRARAGSMEALPAEQVPDFRRIRRRVSMMAPWPVVVQMLGAAGEAWPPMLVDELQVHGSQMLTGRDAAPLEASWTVIGFRAAPGRGPT